MRRETYSNVLDFFLHIGWSRLLQPIWIFSWFLFQIFWRLFKPSSFIIVSRFTNRDFETIFFRKLISICQITFAKDNENFVTSSNQCTSWSSHELFSLNAKPYFYHYYYLKNESAEKCVFRVREKRETKRDLEKKVINSRLQAERSKPCQDSCSESENSIILKAKSRN